ncbi:MAG: hypothetical protein ACOCXM_01625 [Myxococcota bacterium]
MRVLILMGVVLLAGCPSEPDDSSPAGALHLFLDAMDRSEWDEEAQREAYALLSAEARSRLAQRARQAEALSGRAFEPWDMLTRGRFRLRLAPRDRGGMVERVQGDRATVVVRGRTPERRAEVPMVRAEDGWRVALEVPPLNRP